MPTQNRSNTRPARRAILAAVVLLFLGTDWTSQAQSPAEARAPNPSFEQGAGTAPAGWTLEGTGAWGTEGGAEGQRFVGVEGTGTWRSEPVAFAPGGTYELRFRYRFRPGKESGAGFGVAGPEFAFRVFALAGSGVPGQWRQESVRFTAPTASDPETARIHLGQWELRGVLDYDALDLVPIRLAHRVVAGMTLGEGERVTGNEYQFRAPIESPAWRTISRPLAGYNDRFHDNRWRFARPDSYVLYRHEVAGRRQTRATVEVDAWFHEESTWRLTVEVSTDGRTYRALGQFRHGGPRAPFEVPADMLPAAAVWVRLRTDATENGKPVFFQTREYRYSAVLDGSPAAPATGATTLVTTLGADESLVVDPESAPEGSRRFAVRLTNRGPGPVALAPSLAVRHEKGELRTFPGQPQALAAGASAAVSVPFVTPLPGRYDLEFSLGNGLKTRLGTTVFVPVLEAAGYGERLASPDPGVAVWWAASGWKISRTRPAPEAPGAEVRVSLAANEAEAAQVVVRPDRALKGLSAEVVGDLKTGAGDTLAASAVQVLRVRYVTVEYASDELGGTGDWPDPLPPFAGGVDVEAGANQPLWVLVRAPADAGPGLYRGAVTVRAEGFAATVPLGVEVFAFSLPAVSTCRSLFGFSPGQVWRYHNLTSEAEKRRVTDAYLHSFSEHRISPYDPAPLDGFTCTWRNGLAWEGGRVVAEAHSGTRALLAEDTSPTMNSQATYAEAVPLAGHPTKLVLWYRTESADQPAFAYLCYLDAAGNHIPNRNLHVELPPAQAWRVCERTVAEFPPGAASVRLMVQGCPWSDQGEHTGRVWIDDVSLTDTATGQELLRDGGFEAAAPADAAPEIGFDWAAWDKAMDRAFTEYHFNGFVLSVPGLGGGTFHSRYLGSLQGFAQGTPEHTAHFRAWCQAVRGHLAERGWLDKAVVYPFDEPAGKDYPFVVDQLRLLKTHFPGLRRMVPMNLGAADVFVDQIDCWCPIMDSHRRDFAAARQQAGDLYTWYICCGPKAPYIANFIDRAGTDLRVWLWQTWQEHVDGILIWESTYWHSPNAYPSALQDPYRDSMSWVSGYDTQAGEKRRWNVGDGRFMYPPEAAADGTQPQAVLDGPVSSLRWEALRDGLEDFEYLAMLRRLIAAKRTALAPADLARYEGLLAVPPEISRSLTDYTRDPAPVAARRQELAAAIAALAKP